VVTLFDDEWDRPLRDRLENCCHQLADLDRVDQFVHVLGHSRVPFSPRQLAALADKPIADIYAALTRGVINRWVDVVEPEEYMTEPTGLYIGLLVRRR
jgi:hypothetical protein